MHPFGGTPKCARCDKAVYLAEQVIGPGRKLYHKPCLACTSCNKRLDSLSLLEHNQEPYCKPCHVKLFGTRDLRQANLPYRAVSPPLSPSNGTAQIPSPLPSPIRARSFASGNGGNGGAPRLQGNLPITSFPPTSTEFDEEAEEPGDLAEKNLTRTPVASSNITGLSQSVADGDKFTLGKIQTPTGTRYGAALAGGVVTHSTGSPRKWGGNTPNCPKCGKSVFFAEQVKAVGKTYHKACLRCSECNTTLDSSKLRDHEGTPFCSRCYNKLHGPQGNGYALLGKAGG